MIAACPKCAARYRIDREKLGEGGARLRCSRCQSVFRVRAPSPAVAAAPKVAPPAAEPTQPAPQASRAAPSAAASEGRSAERGPAHENDESAPAQVIVAMPDAELAKRTAAALVERGLRPAVVFDGVDAMLEIQRQRPTAVVLAADLPKMFGFQICEIVKRNESLRGTRVVLAGAVHHPDRYRRSPTELYGADAYLEVPDLPEALMPLLEEMGLLGPAPRPAAAPPEPSEAAAPPDPPRDAPRAREVPPPDAPAAREASAGASPAPAAPLSPTAAAPRSPVASAPAAPPSPAAPSPAASPVASEGRAQAERLARIIVSDIVLYNEEKFAAAVQAGDVAQAMAEELNEGRGLFEQRIDAAVRGDADLLMEELLRVARARGMQ